MKALLWKEYRELRAMVALWLVSLLIVQALRQIDVFNRSFTGIFMGLFPVTAALAAIAIGSELLSRERQSKTLDYLLTRPIGVGRMVWAKFVAGSVALLLLVGALLIFAYLPGESGSFGIPLARTTSRVGYPMLLIVVFPAFWFIYSFAFLLSALIDNRMKAVAATIVSLGGSVGVLTAVSVRWPWLGVTRWFPLGHDNTGAYVKLAESPVLFAEVAGVWCALTVGAALLAAAIFPWFTVRWVKWPVLAAGGFTLFFLASPIFQLFRSDRGGILPLGVVFLDTQTGFKLAADGRRVCITTEEGVVAFDFTDPAHPVKIAEIRLPLWKFDDLALKGSMVYLAGRHKEIPEDRAGVVVMSLTAPEKRQVADLGAVTGSEWIGKPVPSGRYLYVGTSGNWESALRVFELSPHDNPRETAAVPIEKLPLYPEVWYLGLPMFSLCVKGQYAYLVSSKALVTLDLSDPAHPKPAHRIGLPEGTGAGFRGPSQIACVGDRLYVQSFWPSELLAYELTDPVRPSRSDRFNWYLDPLSRFGSDGASLSVYVPLVDGVFVFRPRPGLWVRDIEYLRVPRDKGQLIRLLEIAVSGDSVLVLFDGKRVAAYRLTK